MGIVFKEPYQSGYAILKKGSRTRVSFTLDDKIQDSLTNVGLNVNRNSFRSLYGIFNVIFNCRQHSLDNAKTLCLYRIGFFFFLIIFFSILSLTPFISLLFISFSLIFLSITACLELSANSGNIVDETNNESKNVAIYTIDKNGSKGGNYAWNEISFPIDTESSRYQIEVGKEEDDIRHRRTFHVIPKWHVITCILLWILFVFALLYRSIDEGFSTTFSSAYSILTVGFIGVMISLIKWIAHLFRQIPWDCLPMFGIFLRIRRAVIAIGCLIALLHLAHDNISPNFAVAVKKNKKITETVFFKKHYAEAGVHLRGDTPELLWLWENADADTELIKDIRSEKNELRDPSLWYSFDSDTKKPSQSQFSSFFNQIRKCIENRTFGDCLKELLPPPFRTKTLVCEERNLEKIKTYFEKEKDVGSSAGCFVEDPIELNAEETRKYLRTNHLYRTGICCDGPCCDGPCCDGLCCDGPCCDGPCCDGPCCDGLHCDETCINCKCDYRLVEYILPKDRCPAICDFISAGTDIKDSCGVDLYCKTHVDKRPNLQPAGNAKLTFSNLENLKMSIHFPTGHEEQTDPLNAWHTKLHILYWDINSFSAFNKITFTATRDSKDTAKPENTTPGLTKAEIRIGDKGDSCVREFSFIPSSKEEAFVSFQFNTDGVVKKSGELRCRVTDDYDVVFEAQIHKDKPEQQSDDDKKAAGKELLEENRCVSLRFRSYSSDKDKAVIDAVTTLEQDDFFTDSTLLCARESSLDQPVCGSLTCINPEGEGKLKVFDNTILTRDALTIRNVCYITNPAVFKSTGRATYATECTKGVSKISGNYSGEFQKYVADEKCPGGRKLKCESYAYCD